nr:lamin tail domain-containing protein [Anaerolineae bacterium]
MLRRSVVALAAALTFSLPLVSPQSAQGPVPPHRTWLPVVTAAAPQPALISALVYDGFATGDKDEGFQLFNPNPQPVDLAGWQIRSGSRSAVFPPLILSPGGALWCGREAVAFRRTFGAWPACEWGADTSADIPNLSGGSPQFANSGGRVALLRPDGQLSDVIVYKSGSAVEGGWEGAGVEPYAPTSALHEQGQALYRKLDELTARPLPDTDRAVDWASDLSEPTQGRRVRYGGWNFDSLFFPAAARENAKLQVVVAPDASFDSLAQSLWAARSSIAFEGFTFESPALAVILADRARAGLRVTLLLEGAPPGGVSDQQRWCVAQIAGAGGSVYYMVGDSAAGIHDRYLNQHAKIWLIDGSTAIIGSENPSLDSFPNDDKADGTLGRRGVYLATDAPVVASRVAEIIAADLDTTFPDLLAYDPAHPMLGAPPAGFAPVFDSGGARYAAPFTEPLEMAGSLR